MTTSKMLPWITRLSWRFTVEAGSIQLKQLEIYGEANAMSNSGRLSAEIK